WSTPSVVGCSCVIRIGRYGARPVRRTPDYRAVDEAVDLGVHTVRVECTDKDFDPQAIDQTRQFGGEFTDGDIDDLPGHLSLGQYGVHGAVPAGICLGLILPGGLPDSDRSPTLQPDRPLRAEQVGGRQLEVDEVAQPGQRLTGRVE